jgi:outer membrane protein assembly factor BamE (lipoprotein component of BamABCDE complex)
MANAPVAQNSDCGHLVTNVASHFHSIKLVVGALCVLLLCAGCSVRRATLNDVLTPEQVRFIRVGQTTIRELADRIGAPDEVTESDFGGVALYYWSDTKSAALDFSSIPRLFFGPFVPTMTLTKTGITPEQLQVVFDPQWTVRAYGFSRKSTDEPIIWFWPF